MIWWLILIGMVFVIGIPYIALKTNSGSLILPLVYCVGAIIMGFGMTLNKKAIKGGREQ